MRERGLITPAPHFLKPPKARESLNAQIALILPSSSDWNSKPEQAATGKKRGRKEKSSDRLPDDGKNTIVQIGIV